MSGIYVHIPFCVKKCGYCDFFSVKVRKDNVFVDKFFDYLVREISEKHFLFKNHIINTIYIGGGTPSCVDIKYLAMVFDAIYKFYNVSNTAEVTIEINPEHAVNKYFYDLKSLGVVNRLSAGLQAMDNECLDYLGRNHGVENNFMFLDNCRKFGFDNYSVDLIFGYEVLSEVLLKNFLAEFVNRDVPHISAYSLGIEENTPFYLKWKKGILNKPSDDFFLSQFKFIHNFLIEKGYEHYEISNYSKPGMFSRHNSNYWNFTPYLGFGSSAHSFFDGKRAWNFADFNSYYRSIDNKSFFKETEILSNDDEYNEFVMLSLRMFIGLDTNILSSKYPNYEHHFYNVFNRIDIKKWFNPLSNGFLSLTLDGVFISDYIISEFFI